MLRNFITTALRNLKRQIGYTFLNILGLTLGISCSLFIIIYLTHELSFDVHHENADRIFRVSSELNEPDNSFRWASGQRPLAPALKADYPEVEEFCRIADIGQQVFEYEDQKFTQELVFFADSALFKMFTFDLLYGDAETALKEPNTIAINQSMATKIFGNENPVGKILKNENIGESGLKVTAVFKDMPTNSHIILNAVVSYYTQSERAQQGSWGNYGLYSYVMLQNANQQESFAAKLPEVSQKYVEPIFKNYGVTITYFLLPIRDIHLKSDFQGEPQPTSEMAYIYLFAIVGIFMLMIASINYMNLATARSARRAREVGIRKVMGSLKSQLIGQFLSESVIITLASLLVSIGIIMLILPTLNDMLGTLLEMSLIFHPVVMGSLFGILVLVGVLGGSYPAFYLSSFEPVRVLKSTQIKGGGNTFLRKGLVWLQFVISLALLVSTGIVYDQLNFLRDKDLGFTEEPVIRFGLRGNGSNEKWPVLREALLQNPKIKAAGTASSSPGIGFGKILWPIENNEGVMEDKGLDFYFVDYDYFPDMEIEIVEGRNFSEDISTDSAQAVLVNEAMVERMAWDNPIGKKINYRRDSLNSARVVGVVKNFHQKWLYDPIEALAFYPRKNNFFAHLRVDKDNVNETIAYIEETWDKILPGREFEYVFLDEEFFAQYEEDQRRSQIFTTFAIMTIIIACLGLLGLASFTAEQRRKEIGIRKIIGASIKDILVLLTKDFVILVGLATPVAFGAAWYFMKDWLSGFAYYTELKVSTFLFALALVLVITLLTVSYHALRAAKSDPVMALRYE
ncbi:MAG: FtsX-like permease family protein [Bacteroidia bacterium]